jgi:hypothetical protein
MIFNAMKTILNKLFFGCVFIFLCWKGLDGLILNIFHQSTKTYDIEEFENLDKVDARNIEILNGVACIQELMYYEENSYSSYIDVVYPLISQKQMKRYLNSDVIEIKALIRINNQSRDCLSTQNCIPNDSTIIKGLVKVELESLGITGFKELSSELVRIDKNVILIEPNTEPITWYWNLIMFVVGLVFGFTILKSFFQKASTLKEYWDKITEKEETKQSI